MYIITALETIVYPYLSKRIQLSIQNRKLKKLISYAKENSEYYSKKIGDDIQLNKINPVSKIDIIDNFDNIVTDKRIKFLDIKNRMKNDSNNETLLNGKYSITTTSGSTGKPTIIIQDKFFQNKSTLVSFFRVLNYHFPIVTVASRNGMSVAASTVNHNKNKIKLLNKFMVSIDANDPIDEIIETLKHIKKPTIVGYASSILIIAQKLIEKDITIKAKKVIVSGESCSNKNREDIGKAFACNDVRGAYGCTEGGMCAYECSKGHLHIMSDSVILEAVDKDNNIVDYGTKSDKVLITNLNNRVQPIIRYEMNDEIILHHYYECDCGNKDDFITIDNMRNEILNFNGDNSIISISSQLISNLFSEISLEGLDKFSNYQVKVKENNNILCILNYLDDEQIDNINNEIKEKLAELLERHRISNFRIDCVKGFPTQTSKYGKHKRIYMENGI